MATQTADHRPPRTKTEEVAAGAGLATSLLLRTGEDDPVLDPDLGLGLHLGHGPDLDLDLGLGLVPIPVRQVVQEVVDQDVLGLVLGHEIEGIAVDVIDLLVHVMILILLMYWAFSA